MTLSTWDTFRELDALRREVERAFEEFGALTPRRTFRSAFLPGRAARGYPLVNVGEDSDNIYVSALAPGLDSDSLDISVTGNTLRMEGEKRPLAESISPESFHRNERSAGKFTRTIQLGADVNAGKVEADYTNGILSIRLPKAEEAKPKQINVSVQ